MDAPVVINDPMTPVALGDDPHRLVLQGVWATYPGAGRAALRGVDLQLSPGRRVALVGPSGAGKSTLADVLVRFLPADAGEVTLDGVSMERLAADDVRRVVGLVEQNPHLFEHYAGREPPGGTAFRHRRRTRERPRPRRSGPMAGRTPRRPRHVGGAAGHTPVGGTAPAGRRRPRSAGRLPRPGARRAGRAPRSRGGGRTDRRPARSYRRPLDPAHHAPA